MPVENDRTPFPLCGEQEFSVLVHEMVTDEAPRLFAVVQEYGERADGRIAAWGMAFGDHAEIVTVEGRTRMRVPCVERAVRRFAQRPHVSVRLVWVGALP